MSTILLKIILKKYKNDSHFCISVDFTSMKVYIKLWTIFILSIHLWSISDVFKNLSHDNLIFWYYLLPFLRPFLEDKNGVEGRHKL